MIMRELFRTARVVGWKRLLRLYRAERVGWQGIIGGFYTTRTMQTLFNVGFFDELLGKQSVDVLSFAETNDLDTEILQSLCDSLYALGILKRSGTGYGLDSKGKILVEVARGWFDGAYGYEEIFHFLEPLLRKEKAYGSEVTRRSDFVALGSGEMESLVYFPLAIDLIRKKGFKDVLDLGCGDATFLINLCERNEKVTGYGIDIAPEAIADGVQRVKEVALQDRIHLYVEDVSKLVRAPHPLQDIDVATTFFVLHEVLFYGTDRVVDLLRSFRTAFPGVPLIVFEVIRPTPDERRRRPGMAVQYVLQHDLSNQKLVSLAEWREIFRAAGFSSMEERYLRFARTVMFTLR